MSFFFFSVFQGLPWPNRSSGAWRIPKARLVAALTSRTRLTGHSSWLTKKIWIYISYMMFDVFGHVLDIYSEFLNLGFWRAKRCEKLKQEASAKKAKAVNKLLLGSFWCLCLCWPLRSVCPSIVSIRSLFCCRSFLFYEEYCKTIYIRPWLGIPASNIVHTHTLSVGPSCVRFLVRLRLVSS